LQEKLRFYRLVFPGNVFNEHQQKQEQYVWVFRIVNDKFCILSQFQKSVTFEIGSHLLRFLQNRTQMLQVLVAFSKVFRLLKKPLLF